MTTRASTADTAATKKKTWINALNVLFSHALSGTLFGRLSTTQMAHSVTLAQAIARSGRVHQGRA